ncbi:MAG: helix-turn-helix domain-containing protein [Desulfobacterales bacterium]|nr:helix-turn-helix domain-containing protein [Desulfobacterales bacterium]
MSADRMRISTGVSELDPLLGGLLIGDNVVWYDDAGSLAAVFTLNFIQSAEAQHKPFIYVSFDRSPRNLIEKLGPLADNPHLAILDCFTYGKGKGADVFQSFYEGREAPGCQLIPVEAPHDPEEVMAHFHRIRSQAEADVRFVFESLTGMQELWAGEEQISRFYTHTCPRLYELNTIGFWIIEKDAHSKRLKASINQIAQVAIELSLKRGKTSLSVLKAENREIDAVNTPHYYWTKGLSITFSPEKQRAAAQVDIGARVRDLRSKRGISQSELGKLVGVTPSNISQVESNQIYPSITALMKMAEILSVEVGAFFQDKAGEDNACVFQGAAATEVQLPDMPKDALIVKQLTPLDSGARVEAYLIEVLPGKLLPAHFFVHKGEEFGYLLNGKLEVAFGAAKSFMRAGDIIHLTTRMPSQWQNTGTGSAKVLWLKLS